MILRPSPRWVALDLAAVWRSRELLYFLVWRDVKVRYKQTALGVIWVVLQPLLTMALFTLFFGRLAQVSTGGVPYPLFALAGLLPWQLFAFCLTESSNSLVTNQQLLTKVYFPRLLIPLASVLSGLVDFGIACALLLGFMAYYGALPTAAVIWLPAFLLLAVAAALAVGLWLSALNVQFRDVRYTIPFLTQCWLFLTPVAYPASLVPEPWRLLYSLNPMVGVVEGFRWALLGQGAPEAPVMAVSAAMVGVLLVGGLYYFRRMERVFADIV